MTAGAVPADVVSVADYRRHAHALTTPEIWAYIAGPAGDGLTQRRNRRAFETLEIAGRVLSDMTGASTASELFGTTLPFPLIAAPVAYQRLVHHDGETATALGASATGAWMCVSTLSSISLEDISATATAPLVFQLYLQQSRDSTLRLVRRAEAAGYKALMVTVDAPINGIRNAEQRAGFRLPPGIVAANLDNVAPPAHRAGPGESPVFLGLLDHAPTWRDIEWLRSQTTLPLIVKGILHPDDAENCISVGADGLVVSNHGGRTLDTLPATMAVLPSIANRVSGRVPVILDGGVRRGTDIFKAIALGASAVMIGQPIMHALAVAGPVGIAHMLTILRAEFEATMTFAGCRSISDIGRDRLWGVNETL